jgi:hypothetical protein
MKRTTGSTLILVSAGRIARADFSGGPGVFKTAPVSADASAGETVRAALSLGGKAGTVWVLSEDVFAQRVSLSPAQIAGLTPEQIGRALSFEVEPFSGIPISESVAGFHRSGEGAFDVVEISRADRDDIQRAIVSAGGKLAGITHPGAAPADDALQTWFGEMLPRLQGGALPLITPPAPAPSPNRFLIAATLLGAAALACHFAVATWNAVQRKTLESRNAELIAASRELDTANKRTAGLKMELAALDREQLQRERVIARRGSLLALLNGLAATHLDDVVVRGIQAEGPSSLIVSGFSIEAGAVDEMSIVLTQTLRAAGWTAQPRNKTGKRNLPSGGPWEFSLTITHEEAARAQVIQLSQRSSE